MNTAAYIGMLAMIGAFFAGVALWLSHQARAFDRKYGKPRKPNLPAE